MTESELLEAARKFWLGPDTPESTNMDVHICASLAGFAASVTQSQAAEIEERVTNAHNAGFVEASKLLGVEIERYREALEELADESNAESTGSYYYMSVARRALSNDAGGEKNDD